MSSSINIMSIIKYHVMLSDSTHFITLIKTHIQEQHINSTSYSITTQQYQHKYTCNIGIHPFILHAIHILCNETPCMRYRLCCEHIVQPHRPNPGTATKLTSPTHLRHSDSLTNSSPWELATTPNGPCYAR